MYKNKSMGKNAVLNGLRTILNLFFPLITFPYVSKILQVENVGKYNFAHSISSYFILIAGLGIATYAIREGTKYRENRIKISQFASEIFTFNVVSTAIAYLLLFISLLLIPKFHSYTILILIFSIELIFTTLGTEWIFSIYEEYTYIIVRSIVFKIVSIILLFLFVKKTDDLIIYAGITVFSNAGSNLLNWFQVHKYCNIKITKRCNWKLHIKPILIIFASTLATTIYVNSDTTMLGFLASDHEIGIYSVSAKVYKLIKSMLASVLIVSIPKLSILIGLNKIIEFEKVISKIFNLLTLLILPTVVGVFLLSEEIVFLIADSTYEQAASSLRLLCVALIFCIFGWFFNECVLIPAGKEKIVLAGTLFSALLNIVINFFLIPVWKENAVAFSTIMAEGTMLLICAVYALKIAKLSDIKSNFISVIIGCFAIIVICILIKRLALDQIKTTIVCVSSSIIIYGIVLVAFRNNIALLGLKRLKKLFSK